MANLKEIRTRITSVNSTMQITSAMKMVSAAKLKRAQNAVTQMRPYAEKIQEMLDFDGPVIFDCHVDPNENCFPMIPSGKPHNQMILGPNEQEENKITGKGKALV